MAAAGARYVMGHRQHLRMRIGWRAAQGGAACALAAAQDVAAGARSAFALSRPPGHHAGPDFLGGYCFLNNAAIAAQALRDAGHAKVAVLDVDYHHGNGTQAIFYDRPDVYFASIHGDPLTEYPFKGCAIIRGPARMSIRRQTCVSGVQPTHLDTTEKHFKPLV